MGFFGPWFFAGAGRPRRCRCTCICSSARHRIRRDRYLHLMLWEPRTISSTRHRRLHYLLLLALRYDCWCCSCWILAFANPFINRDSAAIANNRIVLLVIDNSFSMRDGTRLNDAKNEAMSVLSQKGAARGQIATFGSRLQIMTQAIEDQAALQRLPCNRF